jgi:hypothetical protein
MQSQDPGTNPGTRTAARPRATRGFAVRPLGSVLLALGAISPAACSGSVPALRMAEGPGPRIGTVPGPQRAPTEHQTP